MNHNTTRGFKSSERKAAYHAFYAGLVIATHAIYAGADLSATSILIGAVVSPLVGYGVMRTAYKRKQGENDT